MVGEGNCTDDDLERGGQEGKGNKSWTETREDGDLKTEEDRRRL